MSLRTRYAFGLVLTLLGLAIVTNYNYYIRYNVQPSIVLPGSKNNDYVSVFSYIYENGHWGVGSGPGSNPTNAVQYIGLLQQYFDDPRFVSIVDLGCGDWQLMRMINIPKNKKYNGFDVVPSLIKENNKLFGEHNVKFNHVSSLKDFAEQKISGDLIIVKDVMQHWPNSEIEYFLANILPNFKYALITNDYIATDKRNKDNTMGPARALSLLKPPFNLQHAQSVLEYDGPEHKQVLFYVNPHT